METYMRFSCDNLKVFHLLATRGKFVACLKRCTALNRHQGLGTLDTYIKSQGLYRSNAYHNLYFLHENEKVVMLVLYVDDLLLIGNHSEKIVWLMEQLLFASKMTD